MPFRLRDADGHLYRAKIQVETSARLPALINRAAQITGDTTNSTYIRRVVCEALAADLGLDYQELIDTQPGKHIHVGRTREDVV